MNAVESRAVFESRDGVALPGYTMLPEDKGRSGSKGMQTSDEQAVSHIVNDCEIRSAIGSRARI